MSKGKKRKSCLDCESYLPTPLGEYTEFGICLNDEAFGPFVEELLEGSIPDSCQGVVAEKKFIGEERSACPDFQESEVMEIDDESPLGQALSQLAERGELTLENLEAAVFEEQVRRTDWKKLPVDHHAKKLRSKSARERDRAISTLGGLIALGNEAAFQSLLEFLSALGPPATLEEVHLKIEILESMRVSRDREKAVPCLVDELRRTKSSNTTRQWISAVLEFLAACPYDVIGKPLERMLSEKIFSRRLEGKVKEALYQSFSLRRKR